MKCPPCGVPKLVHDIRDLPYTYKGESTVIADVTGDFCPTCGEMVLDVTESTRVSHAMLDFNKQVNALIVDPDFIASVRKKLALDQREAAEIFGGGVNAFSRYENGKTKPPLALVKLLKVLDRHPDLLEEVRQDSAFDPRPSA
ncbi:MAG: type II toxin-antitoxin system MqsA family antitoxin [Rhodanobacteraceae bacterium]